MICYVLSRMACIHIGRGLTLIMELCHEHILQCNIFNTVRDMELQLLESQDKSKLLKGVRSGGGKWTDDISAWDICSV